MIRLRGTFALVLLAHFSLQAVSFGDLFNANDASSRARITTVASVAGGALAYAVLANFSDMLPKLNGIEQTTLVKVLAGLTPGLLLADYNDNGELDCSILKGLKVWDKPSLKEAGAALMAIVSLAGAANIAGGYLGASLAEHYMKPKIQQPMVEHVAQEVAEEGQVADKK